MKNAPRKTTVSLEDLLRLKRSERPPAEFWEQFERGLRTKQLAAIVEPRPWWAPFIRVGARVSRYQLPVGATAILAITFLTLREYRTVDSAPVYEPAVAVASSVVAPNPANPAGAMRASPASSAPMAAAEMPAPVAAATETLSDPNAQATALLGSSSHQVSVRPELTPSARYIADNLAAAQADDPELDQMLGRSLRSLESRPGRGEPLTQVSVPGESRRSRLLGGHAWLASAGSAADSALRTDEHSARRLTERRMTEPDAISRVDVGSSHLSVKF